MQVYLVAFIVALIASFLLTPWVKQLAVKWGAMDAPDARKVHTKPIPRMGGLAIYAAFVLAVISSTVRAAASRTAGALLSNSSPSASAAFRRCALSVCRASPSTLARC